MTFRPLRGAALELQRLFFLPHPQRIRFTDFWRIESGDTLQRVSPLAAKLPTSAPLSAEKTRLTLNRALVAQLEKSMGTSTST